MNESDFTGHFDPARNPNSAMRRILANLGYDRERIEVYMTNRDGFRSVKVAVNVLESELIEEAEAVGFDFKWFTNERDIDNPECQTPTATFGIPDGDDDG